MTSPTVVDYLQSHQVPFERLSHPQAVPAQRVAQQLHVSGHHLAKCVVVEADGERWMLALPAAEKVDERMLAEALRAKEVHLLDEDTFAPMFPGCDRGAEPPFGRLFGIPLLCEARLAEQDWIVVRGGSHEEALKLRWRDFFELERPAVARFGRPFAEGPGVRREVEPPQPPSPM